MRSFQLDAPSFLGGVAVGLAASGVALLTARAARWLRDRRLGDVVHPVIDGAWPSDPVALTVRPPEESIAATTRLESEIVDPAPASQKW